MGEIAGRRRRRDPVPALPARAPRPARHASPDAHSASAWVRRPPSSRWRATTRSPSSPTCCARSAPVAARRRRRYPRPDPVLPHPGHQRLAMGVAADPGRRSRSGADRSLPDPSHRLTAAKPGELRQPWERRPGRACRCRELTGMHRHHADPFDRVLEPRWAGSRAPRRPWTTWNSSSRSATVRAGRLDAQSMPSINARSAVTWARSALRPRGVSEIHVVRRPRRTPLWRLR